MTFTPDINLGNALVAAAIAVLGAGLRRFYKLVEGALDTHKQALDDIDDHAEVINMHTTLFVDNGIVKGPIGLPRVEERRRRSRVYTGHST